MIVYRVGKTRYAKDLTGEGARLNGGRWNHKLTPCIYTAESRSLAVLEYTVNVNIEDIPRALSITTFEVPENDIAIIMEAMMPGNWRKVPAPSDTRDFGTQYLKLAKNAVIKIPSVVIPEEFNYLLNPLHADSKDFKILDVKDFIYDVRIKLI